MRTDSHAVRSTSTITARTESAAEFQQNTPFAGLLTERERLKVLAAFDATHPRAAMSA